MANLFCQFGFFIYLCHMKLSNNDWKVAPHQMFLERLGVVDGFAIWKRKYSFSWSKFKYVPTETFERFIEWDCGSQGDDVIEHFYQKEENAEKALKEIIFKFNQK